MTSLYDATTGTVLASQLRRAPGFWGRFRGLMLHRSLPPGEGLAIEPCSSIHMLFMRFPIDAVFYNREHEVTRVARNVRPWRGLAFGGRRTRGVVKLPAGATDDVEPGHQLKFRDEERADAPGSDARP